MSDSPINVGALDVILSEHRAKKAALDQEAAALRELAQTVTPTATAPVPVPSITPGPQTSEGQRSKLQQVVGNVLAIVGSIVAMLSATRPDSQILAIISTVIAGIGGAMGNQASSSYSATRATIKTGGA
jgi:hypothetical protein